MSKPIVIAIDGVSGSGKSTLARGLAKKLGFAYLDTGAMYRALTHKALQSGADFSRPEKLYACVRHCKLRLNGSGKRLWLDGKEVTRPIRGIAVSQHVSILASVPKIRHWMVRLQRSIARHQSAVMEGRDIGTVVFPKAQIKFFLTASLEERARRRIRELRAMGSSVQYETVLKNLADRDARDSGRRVSPLRRATDAILIDSTDMTAAEKTQRALTIVRKLLKA